MRLSALLAVASAILGFSKAQEFSACDPLVPEACLFPFPNNFYLRSDPSSITGSRVRLPRESVPADLSGETFDTSEWEMFDGFSPLPGILTYLPDLDDTNLPHHWDMQRSLDPDCPTVLLDTVTRQFLPHWAELDYISGTRKQALFIWPSERLEDNRRYIVALRYMYDSSGRLIKPSSAFSSLRDRIPTDNYDVEGRRDLFENIFDTLDRVGVRRSELQLAWDFSTASRENLNGRMLAARDDAFARIPKGGPKYTINRIEDNYSDNIYRLIEGEYTVPYYLTSMLPGSHLVLDENQRPVYQGETTATFTVLIPRSLVDSGKSGAILSYGHGLLGGQGEVKTGYLQEIANKNGYVLCATDWVGMSGKDTVAIALMLLRNLGEFRMIPDRLVQGVLNHLLLMKMMTGDFAKDPATTFNGIPSIDVTRRYYYGNSQGGIMGANYMAFSTDVERGVLGVSGGPYGLLLARSVDFTPFFIGIKVRFPDPFDRVLVLSLLSMLWDRSEPTGPLNAITKNPFPNTPVKRVIMQYGLADAQVHYLGAYLKIRSLDAKFFVGQARESNETLYGFEYASNSVSQGSIAVGFDFGAPEGTVPRENVPPNKEYDSHEKVRIDARSQAQMIEFFNTGVIRDTCGGQGCYGFKSATKMTKEEEYKFLQPGDYYLGQ